MNESQRRAWEALELGPRWVARGADERSAPMAQTVAHHGAELPVASRSPAVTPSRVMPASGATLVAHAANASHAATASPAVTTPPAATTSPAIADRAVTIAAMDWPMLREQVAACTACGLCRTRSRTVFGVGATQAPWMIVGEAPGAEEDARGEPFVGQAGRLLDAMLSSIGVDRAHDVFIANVLKCRPPRNRDPEPEEVAACEPFLLRQLSLVSPQVVLVLGRFAAQSLLHTESSIASLRGRPHHIEAGGRRIPVVVTYHPAYLLRNLPDKAKAWSDLLLARRLMREAAQTVG